MDRTFEDEVRAEIEALQEHVRLREQVRERQSREGHFGDLPTIDVSNLELPQIRAIVAERFETARLRNQLAKAERRIAELERTIGRP